jgi:hypothetical protein
MKINWYYWISISWWKYLLENPITWRKFWCRMGGHKCGPIWYNVNGLEPDMRCQNCEDEL